MFPINPGQVTDRQLAPSKGVSKQVDIPSDLGHENTATGVTPSPNFTPPLFSPEKEALYTKRFEENYDISDPEYTAWLKINHPEFEVSAIYSSRSSSLASSIQHSSGGRSIGTSDKQSSGRSDLSDVLVLPQPVERKSVRRKKTGLNSNKTICITDNEVLDELKLKESMKADAEKEKERKKFEREQKRKDREEKKLERERLKEEKRRAKGEGKSLKRGRVSKRLKNKRGVEASEGSESESSLVCPLTEMKLGDSSSSEAESDAVCPKCGQVYSESGGVWVNCDKCNQWFDLKCTNLKNPEFFYCEDCV